MEKIDFVVTWLDSNDPEWIAMYNYYRPEKPIMDRGRFRNWDIFRYWFRSVEQYAPWVNKVYLVTNGKNPDWINTKCPKLVLVKHSDYIPDKYLPTFNSRTIELNFDKIVGLSECFVYFNDDTYLNAPTKPEDFFVDGLPCDCNAESMLFNPWYDPIDRFSTKISIFCDVAVVNRHFDRRAVVRQAKRKWLGPHLWNGPILSSLLLMGSGYFQFFKWRHWEQPLLKSIISEIWDKEPQLMQESCTRFRQDASLNSYIFRYWQFASNKFHPVRCNTGKVISLSASSVDEACQLISDGKMHSICLNDNPYCTDEEAVQIECELREVFERKFPRKSMFEL
jgi:hypothetical protein